MIKSILYYRGGVFVKKEMSMVSIIVPVYNVEKSLALCVDSICKQTYSDIEILLIDDGSTDNSGRICEEYKDKDIRLRVIHKSNGGLSDARNAGIDVAIGDWLLFVDSDDWLEDKHVESLVKSIEDNQCDISVCGYCIDYIIDGFCIDRRLDEAVFYKEGKMDIGSAISILDSKGMFNSACNKMYKSEIIKTNDLYFVLNGQPGEDLLFNCSYWKYVERAGFISSITYHYVRYNEESLATKYYQDLLYKTEWFNGAREKLYIEHHMYPKHEAVFIKNTVQNWSVVVYNLYKDKNMPAKLGVDQIRTILAYPECKKYIVSFRTNNLYEKLFVFLMRTQNCRVIYWSYKLLFSIRERYDKVYRALRRGVLKTR